jgi:hypothetical protein
VSILNYDDVLEESKQWAYAHHIKCQDILDTIEFHAKEQVRLEEKLRAANNELTVARQDVQRKLSVINTLNAELAHLRPPPAKYRVGQVVVLTMKGHEGHMFRISSIDDNWGPDHIRAYWGNKTPGPCSTWFAEQHLRALTSEERGI